MTTDALLLPRPAGDSGLGFYYQDDDIHYRQSDLDDWLPVLKRLGASWLTLRAPLSRAIPEGFLRRLIANDIEPVIHLPVPVGTIDVNALNDLLRVYARWGLHYVVVFDQPNTRAAWPVREWSRSRLVARFAHHLLPVLRAVRAAGLVPALPPLAQGGDYWHTVFLSELLGQLHTLADDALLRALVLGVYGYTLGKPSTWGQGGAAAWPDAKPYHTPDGAEDSLGFRAFEWYGEVAETVLGQPLPMLMLAGGARMSDEHEGPKAGQHTATNVELASLKLNQQLAPHLLNLSFWLLAGDSPDAWFASPDASCQAAGELAKITRHVERKALVTAQIAVPAAASRPQAKAVTPVQSSASSAPPTAGLSAGRQLPIQTGLMFSAAPVQAIAHARHGPALVARAAQPAVRIDGIAPLASTPALSTPLPTAGDGDKPVAHYVLLPSFEWGGSHWYWQVVADYVQKFRPAAGFSMDEARRAGLVTIVADAETIPEKVAQALQQDGCEVERIAGATNAEIQTTLNQLVKQGVRRLSELT